MNDEVKKRTLYLFDGVESALQSTDPEWVDIVANFSQNETIAASGLTEKEQMLCVLRRNINRWLADNCFGDYYTRNGLNDQECELITFCFILAQGGCENQLRGHTAGNFGVGNDKEKLYSVVEQCMPYIGYPRSLNAMNIIDEVSRAMENQ